MDEAEILEALESRGAVLRGHFRLSSGRHSDVFVQKFRVFEDPLLTRTLGEQMAQMYEVEPFDTVASPAVGAIVLGYSVALASAARMIFSEREDDRMAFRRGFGLEPGERVLVVEDVVTTGGSAREVVDLVRSAGAEPVGVAVLLDRSDPGNPPDLGVPLRSLVRLDVASFTEEECPQCAEELALEDPGSRRLRA
jgi:orotate phosphoribosyltransferase